MEQNPPCDFGIVCGSRGEAAQEAAFDAGNSKAHYGESPHNAEPPFKSLAVDVAPFAEGNYLWKDNEMFEVLAEHITAIAKELYDEGWTDHKIEWGGAWFKWKDRPHWQLCDWKALRDDDGW